MSVAPPRPGAAPATAPVRGPLQPVELASAGVLGGVTLVLAVIGVVVPIASILQVLAAVPLAVVAHRHRPRALVAAAVAACVVGFLVAGTAPISVIVVAAAVGGTLGEVRRRGWGPLAAAVALVPAFLVLAGVSVGLLLVFSNLRELTLETIRNSAHGVGTLLGPTVGAQLDAVTATLVEQWWWTVVAGVVVLVVFNAAVTWLALGAVLSRVPLLPPFPATGDPGPDAPAPVPVALEQAGLRYPGARRDALTAVDLRLERPELVAVVGHNGSGKSTVVRLLAGVAPTRGRVVRPGAAGLGRPGGTALVSQRPESQVLGARVRDDVVWGLPRGVEVDVEGLLGAVGLAGLGDRSTTALSGGQLQRLAIAAALARRPALLLSDESTAMVDPQGRTELVGLLAALPARTGTTVVHVTHRAADAEVADRVVAVHDGRATELQRSGTPEPPPAPVPPARPVGPPLVALRGVGHVYDARTPWAHRALGGEGTGVDLDVVRGEALLLVGGNGSGKTTLAWILAGLLRPTEGTATLGGEALHTRPRTGPGGSVAIAFQHARLQVQRPTVGEDVAAAGRLGGGAHPAVAAALRTVGLDPSIAAAGTDSLSGGQLRRVALAGLLVGRPDVLVLDEPLAGLDAPSRAAVADVLAGLRDRGVTLVVVTHDLAELAPVCHRVVHVVAGQLLAGGSAHGSPVVAR